MGDGEPKVRVAERQDAGSCQQFLHHWQWQRAHAIPLAEVDPNLVEANRCSSVPQHTPQQSPARDLKISFADSHARHHVEDQRDERGKVVGGHVSPANGSVSPHPQRLRLQLTVNHVFGRTRRIPNCIATLGTTHAGRHRADEVLRRLGFDHLVEIQIVDVDRPHGNCVLAAIDRAGPVPAKFSSLTQRAFPARIGESARQSMSCQKHASMSCLAQRCGILPAHGTYSNSHRNSPRSSWGEDGGVDFLAEGEDRSPRARKRKDVEEAPPVPCRHEQQLQGPEMHVVELCL